MEWMRLLLGILLALVATVTTVELASSPAPLMCDTPPCIDG
jgi:hypothetical protein